MKLFEYIYYRITNYYRQFKHGEGYFLMGIIVVSILQFFNLFVILAFLSLFNEYVRLLLVTTKYGNNRIAFLLIISFLLFINYVLYHKLTTFEKLASDWKSRTRREIRHYNLYFYIYLIVSLSLLIITSKIILLKL
jgi:hypothetical protein